MSLALLPRCRPELSRFRFPIPQGGAHDERTVSVFADTAPAIVLTASSVVDNVVEYVQPQPGQNAPAVIEVDRLDLDARPSSGSRSAAHGHPDILYLQYTSGSTRTPAGVMVSNKNLFANFEQIMTSYYGVYGKVAPPGSTVVSWLPFYHDMGFVLGLILPILAGIPAVLTSPIGFLQRPARWIQMLASNTLAFTAAPNFAFDLASRKTKDEDMEGLDLGGVHGILNGSERVQPVTLKRFIDRFAPFNLDPKAIRPSYGMAEATVYVATRKAGQPPKIVQFDPQKLPDGQAERTESDGGTPLVSYGIVDTQLVRIVDPDTGIERPAGTIGEIWVHGDNVAIGYWQKPEATERTFSATIVNPSEGTPAGPWLRTGDSGFLSEGELFIMGRATLSPWLLGIACSPIRWSASSRPSTSCRLALARSAITWCFSTSATRRIRRWRCRCRSPTSPIGIASSSTTRRPVRWTSPARRC